MSDHPKDDTAAPYRDDPKDFAQSSSRVQRGVSNRYSGQGTEDTSAGPPDPELARGNNHGSQADWKSPQATTAPDDGESKDASKPE